MLDQLIITVDIDWAPDWMLEYTIEKLSMLKTTYFITNDTPLQRELGNNIHFAGYHPNLLQSSSQGKNINECFQYFDRFLPELYMSRLYFFGHSYHDLRFLSNRNIKTQNEWYEKMSTRTDEAYFCGRSAKDQSLMSVLNYSSLNWADRNANVGWYFSPDHKNNGLTAISVLLFLNYLFNELGLMKVYSQVYTDNKRANTFNTKIGFVVEGVLKRHSWNNGSYKDMNQVALFPDVFMQKNAKILQRYNVEC